MLMSWFYLVLVLQMTANALTDNMVECFTHGMDSFIAKPVTFTKLEQVLKQFIPWLDRTQSSSMQLNADG
jgi:CheY-like chemotaxis protein